MGAPSSAKGPDVARNGDPAVTGELAVICGAGNATDAFWTQTARLQSRTTSTGLYICNILT
jgi:hypothetical protein